VRTLANLFDDDHVLPPGLELLDELRVRRAIGEVALDAVDNVLEGLGDLRIAGMQLRARSLERGDVG
jgi:hypothetical protein